jgi:hypothetical protein
MALEGQASQLEELGEEMAALMGRLKSAGLGEGG